jgi:hypothetical protein
MTMKRIFGLIAVLSVGAAGAAWAGGNYPMGGCGLAYVLFAKDANTQGVQIFAATTNNSYGTQSFAITSGTSGCAEGGFKASAETMAFAEVNLKNLESDMARGGGEYVETLASLLHVAPAKRGEFFVLARENYKVIFPSAGTESAEMMSRLSGLLTRRPDLLG